MTLGSAEAPVSASQPIMPTAGVSHWFDVNTAPQTADNSGNPVLSPVALTRAEIKVFRMHGRGTTVQFRLEYEGTVTTPPVVQVFGLDRDNVPERLVDEDGLHEQSLAADTTNDVKKGDKSYTASKEVDANNAESVMVTIKTALAGTATGNDPKIQARIK